MSGKTTPATKSIISIDTYKYSTVNRKTGTAGISILCLHKMVYLYCYGLHLYKYLTYTYCVNEGKDDFFVTYRLKLIWDDFDRPFRIVINRFCSEHFKRMERHINALKMK